jgi:hypothetical protein
MEIAREKIQAQMADYGDTLRCPTAEQDIATLPKSKIRCENSVLFLRVFNNLFRAQSH